MGKEQRCMGCMRPLPEGRQRCEGCGYPAHQANDPAHLPAETVLSERYLVGRVLETRGDAAVYMGYDQVLKAAIRIREYGPQTLAARGEGGELQPLSGCERAFAAGLEAFRAQARTLARLRDLHALIPTYDIFDQNGTVYTVGEYVEGVTLTQRLKQAGGRLSWDEARPLLMPLLQDIMSLHVAGVRHLGICPDNLLLAAEDGKLRLTGFTLPDVRRTGGDLRPDLPAGYAAPEQYTADKASEDVCGAPADVYALAATLFHMLTGNPPPDAAARTRGAADLFVPTSVASSLPRHVAATLFQGLQVSLSKRIATVEALRDQLAASQKVAEIGEPEVSAQAVPAPPAPVKTPPPPAQKPEDDGEKPPRRSRSRGVYALLIVGMVVILLGGVTFAVLYQMNPGLFEPERPPATTTSAGGETTTSATETTDPTQPTETPVDVAPVANLKGKKYYTELKDKAFGGRAVKLGGLVYSSRPFGEVVEQTPPADRQAPMGEPITVYISLGMGENVAIPNVAGWKAVHAQEYLEAIGFTVEVVQMPGSALERGLVDSTDPVAGTLRPRGTKVILRVSDREPAPPAVE